MKTKLQLNLLGPPKISLAGQPLVEPLSSKAEAILYYLAVTGQPQTRIALATLLWGDIPEAAARSNLRKVLGSLRQALEGYLDIDRHEIAFRSEADIWVDAVEFGAIISGSRQRVETPLEAQQLQGAVDLYGGDFLAGFYALHAPDFESWLVAEQARLRELAIQALQTLAGYYTEKEAWASGLACIRRLLNLEPWREEAHRQLMLLLAYNGQRSAALAQLEICRQVLEAELGVEPGPETVAVYEHIRDGKVGLNAADSSSASQKGSSNGAESPSHGLALPPFSYNLPALSTAFIGRAAELMDILRRLTDRDCRLLTLVGPGGIGKTRLAVRTAQTFMDTQGSGEGFFAHGLVFVSLAGVNSTSGMISAIAEAANFTFYSSVPPRQQLLNYLQEKNMLLVLDNLEHLLDEGSLLISEILAAAPEIKILVTSREALNLQEAWFHPVEGMSFPPEPEAEEGSLSLEKYDAVQLFVQSANRVRVEFNLATEQSHVIRICQLVEGMPLGIELAAAWLKLLPADKIVREIERGLDILSTRLQNVPSRHHSMRAVFEQSWQLLTGEEQEALKRLSVFRSSFTEAAAEQVAGASFLTLAILAEKSLVRVIENERYQMHELLRQFAGEKLALDTQAEAIARERHSAYYLGFLKAREEMMTGPEQQQVMAEIDKEIKNIGVAWRWAVEQGYLAAIDRAIGGLYNFYQIRSRYQEGKEIFEKAVTDLETSSLLLEHPEGEKTLKRLRAREGGFHAFLGNYETAYTYLEAGLNLASEPAEKELMLYLLGDVAVAQGKRAMAEAWFRQALALSQERGNLYSMADGFRGLAYVASSFGDFATGQQLARESLAISRQIGQPFQLARTLATLAWATNCLGEYREAEGYWRESLVLCQEIGDRWGAANSLSLLGWSAWCEGAARLEEAIAYHKEALAICREIGHRRDIAMCLGDLALAAGELGEYEQAIQYSREGLTTAENINHADMTAYNLYCLGAAVCGLDDFPAARAYLIKSLKVSWEARITGQTTSALFYWVALLAKESDRTGVTDSFRTQQKANALELLILLVDHPACWQAIKDRAASLQAQLEADLGPDSVTAAKMRAESRAFEEVIAEIVMGEEAKGGG